VCELLVRVTDKPVDHPHHHRTRAHRGDVVVAVPDGHDWTEVEKAHPEWVILSVPGMSVEEGERLAAPTPPGWPAENWHKRMHRLDLDHADAHEAVRHAARTTAAGGNVTRPVVVAADHVRTLVRRKPTVNR
jgi:hypothetical protein